MALTQILGLGSLAIALFIVLIVGMLLTSLWAWAIERLAYRPLRGSFRLAPLISAIGMSIFLSNLVQVTQGPRNKPVPFVLGEVLWQLGRLPEALAAWRAAAGITSGPLFCSIRKGGKVGARLCGQSVAEIVKAAPKRNALDPALYAAHSLRSGFLTSAAKRGASIFKMMDQSRHRSVDTLRGYVRDAEIFKDHAGAGLL
jgi:hypothetical protein